MSEFIRIHPRVTAELLFVDRVVNLVEEGLDVAVRIGHLSDSSLVAVPVGNVRRVLCASPEYLRRNGTPRDPEEIRTHRCVRHMGLSPRNEWHFTVGRHRVAVPISCVITCNEIDSSLSACLDGLGLGMFLSYQVANEKKAGGIRYLLEEFETEPLPVSVVYPHSGLLSNKVRAFVDACVEELRHVPFE